MTPRIPRSINPGQQNENNKTLAIIILLISVLIIDTSLFRISDLIRVYITPNWATSLFVFMSAVYLLGQHVLIRFARTKSRQIRELGYLHLKVLDKSVTIIQYLLSGIIVFVLVQVVIFSEFYTSVVSTVAVISYLMAIFMMIFLSIRFFSWFRLHRNPAVLFYFLSTIVLTINAAFSLALILTISPGIPSLVGESQIAGMTRAIAAKPFAVGLNNGYTATSILTFILLWLATALLLREYSRRIGKITYWTLVSIPLVYFLSQFPALFFNLFGSLIGSNPTFYGIVLTLIFSLSKITGGILFGVAFWTVAKHLPAITVVKSYMVIAAYGFILFYISNQAGSSLFQLGGVYPPFGLPTIAVIGFSSYLMLVGIYSSAISVAQDSRLRRTIRKSVQQQSSLLDKIGTAQMQQEIENKVLSTIRSQAENLRSETGIETSLDENEIRDYMKEVIAKIITKKREK
ncbi:MAG TPA: hypothetical protein VFY41_07545 [Nitrososphaeraceae archaeon]|nr:hypothetical protein [Nitrososphaeraceae archaeon]